MNYKDIGRKMKEIRINKNLSQEEFAEEIGITASYLGQIERGQRKISLPTLEKISERTGVPIEIFICNMNTENELQRFWESATKDLELDEKEELANAFKVLLTTLKHIMKRDNI